MRKIKNTENVNWAKLRENSGLTLAQLSEMTGYSVATINGLELKNEGSSRLREKLESILISRKEEGVLSDSNHWRKRALAAEEKLRILKSGIETVLRQL
jgi:transcriptional regulator with XRE-family HTH domain